jgi:hypothetical protein
MNNRKLVSIAQVAKEIGAVDSSGIANLAQMANCYELVAGVPHVVIGPFRRAYKAAIRATTEAREVSSDRPKKIVSDETRLKMQLGKIPGRIKKLDELLRKAGIEASTNTLAFKRDDAARRVMEITSMIREQRDMQTKLETQLNALVTASTKEESATKSVASDSK